MYQIKSFTDCNYKAPVGEMLEASRKVAKQYGLEIGILGCPKVSRADVIFQLCATALGAARADYLEFAKLRGLPKNGLGKTFRVRRHTYTITGLKPYCRYEVVTTREDGQRYDWPLEEAARLMKHQETATGSAAARVTRLRSGRRTRAK
jgi:hypothetical protein